MNDYPILFVCHGNICRSPLGEGIFRHLAQARGLDARYPVDSAGTGGWHIGHAPDRRSIAVALRHGIDISAQRARRVTKEDFDRFALILAMDHENLRDLQAMAPRTPRAQLQLFGVHALGEVVDVPDPYYGGEQGFETVYNMLFAGCSSLLEKLAAGRAS